MKNLKVIIVIHFLVFLYASLSLAGDYSKAIELFNQGTQTQDSKEKERIFKEAIAQPCDDQKVQARIHNNLSDAFEKQSKFQEAIVEYKKAIEFDPDLPTPYIGLGDVYSKSKNFKSAEIYYKKYSEMARFKNRELLTRSLRAIKVIPTTGQKVAPSEDLYFGFNETFLTQESERQLQELLAAMGDDELKNYRFQLAGHTCSIGSESYNQKLSEDRARAVKNWLVKNGYPAVRLQLIGFGKKKPVADNSTEEGRKLNRRVEIRTLGGKE